jgi:TonB family protein
MPALRRLLTGTLAVLTLASAAASAVAQDAAVTAWPATIVKFEDLRPLTDFQLRVPGIVAKGQVTGPAILRVHVTAEGTVARAALLQSCGNPDLDEASLHAMRVMRFKPHTFGGTPIEVTLIAPVHVPARFGRSPG